MLRLRRRALNEDGNVLITVILVSVLVGALASMVLATARHADRSSASDRNHEMALAVAESGVHDAITRIESQLASGYVADVADFTSSTDEGTYEVKVDRQGEDFVIDAEATVGTSAQFQRSRHVRVRMSPPELFPDAGYALFSSTNLYLKNNNEIYDGDIWANDSLWVESNAEIDGSVTSAQSWIKLESGTNVVGSVLAGGRKCTNEVDDGDPQTPPDCTEGWAIDAFNTTISKWAKSSVSAPNCASGIAPEYSVHLGTGANASAISEDLFTVEDAPVVGGTYRALVEGCTVAPPAKPAPTFIFNKWNYDPATYVECPSAACPGAAGSGAAAFTTWLTPARKIGLQGTFVIQECNGGIVNLNGVAIGGDVTIITNPAPCGAETSLTGARVDTDGVDQVDGVPEGTEFVVVSHYRPPANSICTENETDQCAVVAKNQFEFANNDCEVSFLIYADNGPVAVKNNPESCGSVIAAGIQMKNNLQLTYDPVFDRILGFGPRTYEIARWEELPTS